MPKAEIKFNDHLAGWLTQDGDGYHFVYDKNYLQSEQAQPVSATLPLQQAMFTEKILFPFFDGLIPEGWLLDVATNNWKINPRDRMALLMACCKDCIGAVSVHPTEEEPK
jgi:serine/threonine-protein kinase HipA